MLPVITISRQYGSGGHEVGEKLAQKLDLPFYDKALILSSLQSTGWSKTTIQTYLARLVKKGALTTQRQGKGYLYYPALSQAQCQLEESKSFLHRVYGGSLSKMVLGFVESGSLSQKELEELKELVNQQEEGHDPH